MGVGKPTGELLSGWYSWYALFNLYNRTDSSLVIHAGLPSFPVAVVNAVKFSLDGLYVFYALNVSPWLVGYKRVGDVFTKLALTANSSVASLDLAISPDGNYMAVNCGTLDICKKQSDGSWLFLVNKNFSYTTQGCCWSPDSAYLVVTLSNGSYILRLKRTGDTFTQLSNPTTLPLGICYKCQYSPDGNFVAVRINATPYIFCYHIVSDTQWDKIVNPAVLPAGSGQPTDNICFANGYLYMSCYQNAGVLIYTVAISGLTYVNQINTSTSTSTMAISVDGKLLAIGLYFSPFFE